MRGTILWAIALWLAHTSCRSDELTPSSSSRTILFVCKHGVGMSAIAAAHFDKLAHESHLPYRAQFRGVEEVGSTLPVAIRAGLSADGVDTTRMAPAALSERELEAAEHIIVLDAWLPDGERFTSKATYWNDIPSPGENFAAARDDIRERIARLVRLLEAPSD